MTSHKDHQLDQLGINSQYEADEFEHELDIRFDRFAYHEREAWVQQNAYLDAYANTRAVSDAADTAGVTVPTAQAWKFLNTLGFKRRLEIADLRFSDSLQVMALERAREPDAPASLLIALLRAHIPEKFSSNGHTCDTSKADELLFHYSQDAKRELDAGHPTFRAIANGTYQPRHERRNTQPHNYDTATEGLDTPNRHTGEEPAPYSIRGRYPEKTHSNLSPAGEDTPHSNLSPAGGEIQRGGSFPENQYDSQETTLPHDDIHPVDPDEVARANLSPSPEEHTSSPSPVVGESLPRTRYGGWGEGEGEMPRPQNPAPSTQNPSASSAPSAVNPSPTPQNPAPSTQNPSAPSVPSAVNPSPTPQNPAPSTQNPSAPSAPSAVNPSPTPQNPAPSTQNPSASSAVKPTRRPIASIFQTRRPSQNDDPNTFKVTRF